MAEESFTEPEPNLIVSTDGFSVRVVGRTGMRYVEGERSLAIDSEVLAAPNGIVMVPASIKFWEPSAAAVTEQERARVVANVRRAFEACGHHLEVAEPFDWDSVAIRRPEDREGKLRAFEAGVSRAEYEAGWSTDDPSASG